MHKPRDRERANPPSAAFTVAWFDDPAIFRHFILTTGAALVKFAHSEESNVITP